MKTLIAAVIASAVSFGAFAQSTPAAGSSAPMAAKSSDSMTKKAPAKKSTKKHAAKKSTKKAAAPAA